GLGSPPSLTRPSYAWTPYPVNMRPGSAKALLRRPGAPGLVVATTPRLPSVDGSQGCEGAVSERDRPFAEGTGDPPALREGLPVPGGVSAGGEIAARGALLRQRHLAVGRGQAGGRVRSGPPVVAPPAGAAG